MLIKRTVYIKAETAKEIVDSLEEVRQSGRKTAETNNCDVCLIVKRKIGKLSVRVAEIHIHKPRGFE